MTDEESQQETRRSWVDEIEVAGERLVAAIRELAADASAKSVRIKSPDGSIAVELPLTIGALAGGAVVLAAPILAVLGVLAAFAGKLKLEVVREDVAEAETAKDEPEA